MRVLIAFVVAIALSSCASPLKREGAEPSSGASRSTESTTTPAASGKLTVEQQNEKAFEIFQQMYEMSGSLSPEELRTMRIEQYNKMISNYPEAGLAQEAHWKLVRIYVREFDPPAIEKAERVYEDFSTRYPDSVLIPEVQNELIRFYVKKKMWESLLRFTAPIVKARTEKPVAMPLYYYGEASYQLDRKEEAKVAFEMAVKDIPKQSYLYKMAVDRLVELGGEVPADDTATQGTRRRRPKN